jgi:glyoxylase-like metal-dependent hydrolase (beta-lactamase superfamily II)
MAKQNRLKTVEGIWITRYHDDHTGCAQALADHFRCRIYFTPRLTDILEHPSHYRMPCLTTAFITSGKPQPDGMRMRWHEFQLTFFDFPGQALYRDGLLVERDGGGALFFTGDSFTPSGTDDDCLQNRDFVAEGEGYLYCLDVLQRLPKNVWLVNQHVDPRFRFSADQLARMRAELLMRIALLKELAPWSDPNYAIDESWAAVHPYGSEALGGENVTLRLRILNHAPQRETYRVKWNVPPGWKTVTADPEVTIPSHQEGRDAGDIHSEGRRAARGHGRCRVRGAAIAGVDRGGGAGPPVAVCVARIDHPDVRGMPVRPHPAVETREWREEVPRSQHPTKGIHHALRQVAKECPGLD